MNKEEIIERMQQYLAGNIVNPDFDTTIEMDDLQAFYCRTAKRLMIAYELLKGNSDYWGDFLLAFRDALLIFESSMAVEGVEIADDDKVYEYCAGCNAHKNKHSGDAQTFPLKKNIKEPVINVESDQKLIFESQDELVVIAKPEERLKVIEYLERQRLACLVATNQQIQNMDYFDGVSYRKSTYIVGPEGIRELLKKENYYYVSGMIAILYPEREDETFEVFKMATQYLRHKVGIHVVHRSGKPLIVTTNLTLNEMNNPQDTAHARIYDRLKELCVPVKISGESRRRVTAQAKLNRLKEQMREEVL